MKLQEWMFSVSPLLFTYHFNVVFKYVAGSAHDLYVVVFLFIAV